MNQNFESGLKLSKVVMRHFKLNLASKLEFSLALCCCFFFFLGTILYDRDRIISPNNLTTSGYASIINFAGSRVGGLVRVKKSPNR